MKRMFVFFFYMLAITALYAVYDLGATTKDRSIRPHSAPTSTGELKGNNSFSCLTFLIAHNNKHTAKVVPAESVVAESSQDPRPKSADSAGRSGSVSPTGSIHATVKIKGAKGMPVKATFIIGGATQQERTEEDRSTSGAILRRMPVDELEEEESADGCAEKACGCFTSFLKIIGLASCCV